MKTRAVKCQSNRRASATCRILARRAKFSAGNRRPRPADARVSSKYSIIARDCDSLHPSMSRVGIWDAVERWRAMAMSGLRMGCTQVFEG